MLSLSLFPKHAPLDFLPSPSEICQGASGHSRGINWKSSNERITCQGVGWKQGTESNRRDGSCSDQQQPSRAARVGCCVSNAHRQKSEGHNAGQNKVSLGRRKPKRHLHTPGHVLLPGPSLFTETHQTPPLQRHINDMQGHFSNKVTRWLGRKQNERMAKASVL